MKNNRLLVIGLATLVASGCVSQIGSSGRKYKSNLAGQTIIGNPTDRNVILSWRSPADPSKDSIYWQPPTQITVFLQGQFLVRVGRLANMRRRPSLLDQGYLAEFSVGVRFYNARLANGQCAGALIHSAEYPIINLNYKQEQYGATNTSFDRRIQELGGAIKCILVSARWRLS